MDKERKIIKTLDGRFMWKEVENGSATGLRSEGDFETEAEAMADAGLTPKAIEEGMTNPEEVVDETISEEVTDETFVEAGPTPAGDKETEEKKTSEDGYVESSEGSLGETPENL